MNLIPGWHKHVPNWRELIHKSLPYLMVAIFVSATTFAVLGMQETKQEHELLEETRIALQTNQQELEDALSETEKLKNQLETISSDIQALLDKAQLEENAVTDKITELQTAYETVEEREQQRWVLPIRYLNCSSYYGNRDHPVEGEAKFHAGLDLAAPEGTPIVASRSGTIEQTGFDEYNGNFVKINHLDGYTSCYLHMSKYIVEEGQFVLAGQIIGYCGNTGVSTGAHLHFGIQKDGNPVNPAKYIDLY